MSATATLTVVRPGLLTSVQDLGRWGHQALGVPVAGPMDALSHRLANARLGNPPDAATLEMTLLGPELRADGPMTVAVAGADFDLYMDERPVPATGPIRVAAGARLRFGTRHAGARAYLAVAGGVLSPPVLGSRATHLVAGMGGHHGRALATGDVVPVGATSPATMRPARGGSAPFVLPAGRATLRVMLGPQDQWFSSQSLERLVHDTFRVSPRSNRMGFRLEGAALTLRRSDEPLSEPVAFGAIQVPPGGEPILLMADRQTAGGYPKIATVIAADLALAGQLAPGDLVSFQACTRAEALTAMIARERDLLRLSPEAPAR